MFANRVMRRGKGLNIVLFKSWGGKKVEQFLDTQKATSTRELTAFSLQQLKSFLFALRHRC
jgi:hypothetical protein